MSDCGNSIIPTDCEPDAHYSAKIRRRKAVFGDWTFEYRLTESGEVDEVYFADISEAGSKRLGDDRQRIFIDLVDTLFKADASTIYEFLAEHDFREGEDAE